MMALRQTIKMKIKINKALGFSQPLIALLMLLTMSVAVAQQPSEGLSNETSTEQSNASLPIDITADSGSYDQQAGYAIYEGNVIINQGVATIHSDKLEIILVDNQVEKMIATGTPATIDYQGEKQPIYGEGNTLTYLVTEKTLQLTNNALVRQGKDEITGSKLSYQLDEEKITGERVKLILQPAN